MSDNIGLPEGLFPNSTNLEALRNRYGNLIRFIYGREQGLDNAFIILIGGGAAVGKSTLAWQIASVMGVRTVIGTDVIRQIVRHERPDDDAIQAETWAVGSRVGGNDHDDQMYLGLVSQSARLQPLIEAMCTYLLGKGMAAIVEGIHLVPSVKLTRLAANPRYIVFFVDATESRIRLNYRYRAVSTHMRSSSEGFSEVNRRLRLHREIVKRARASGLPILSADDWPALINSAITLVEEKLGAR